MNLAFVVQQGLYPFGGGTGVYLDRMPRRLARLGNRIWLISNTPKDADDYLRDGVRFLHVPTVRSAIPFTALLRWEARVVRILREIEAEHGLDLVEFPSYFPEALLYAFRARRAAVCIRVHESRTPVGLRWLVTDPKDALREALCRLQMTRADVILPVSDALRDNCVLYMGAKRHADKIHTVRPGYDLSVFAPVATPPARYRGLEGKRIILFVGRITELKGAYNLIEAYARAIGPRFADTVLVLVGVPEEPERLRQALEGRGTNVLHFSDVETSELPALYSHAYVFAGPSQNEGFGATFVEALACGVPVVSVARGGPLEIVGHEQTGLLCPDNSPGSIAAALDRLLGDPALRDRMARSARASVLGRYGVERAASDLLEIYSRTADRRNSSGKSPRAAAGHRTFAASKGEPATMATD
jgi:glycosyltransferase involved in cell wall biosynthesis